LTEELGVFEVIAKGARKGASRLSGASEPLSASVLYLAIGKKRWYVVQAQPVSAFPGIRADFDRLMAGLALAELAEAVCPHEQPAPEAFRLLLEALRYFEVHKRPLVAAVWAELRLLAIAGFQPSWEACVVCGKRLQGARTWLSPHAGGYVCDAHCEAFSDRFSERTEVAIGLSRTEALPLPPDALRHATDCYEVLGRFWSAFADRQLPAMNQARQAVRANRTERIAP
jgi:DNA repair protein RecO (recombination protein O)